MKVKRVVSAPQRINIQDFMAGHYLLRMQAEGKRDILKQETIASNINPYILTKTYYFNMKITLNKTILWLCIINVSLLQAVAQTPCTSQTLWAWGNNTNGFLGDGTNISRTKPIQIGTNADWKQLFVGVYHFFSIKTDGSLWGWGTNNYGQLGNGTDINQTIPVKIGLNTDWKQIAIGVFHTLAIRNDGSLWAWGLNQFGQIGDGTNINMMSPKRIGNDNDWKKVGAGTDFSVAIKNDGSLWTWGHNEEGQLGDGSNNDKNIPTKIANNGWKDISVADYYSLALKNDGSLWAWGDENPANLPDELIYGRVPVQIGNSTDWKNISAGYNHRSLALKNDGSLWAWGRPYLGDGSSNFNATPIKIGNSTDWQQLSTGFYNSLAIKNDGSLWAWGYDFFADYGFSSSIPYQIGLSANWKQVESRFDTYFALKCATSNTFLIDPTKNYRIVSKVSNKPLQVKDAALTDGAQIYQWQTVDYDANQLWKFVKTADGRYNIISVNSGKYMDILDNTPAGYCVEGTIIQQFAGDGTNSQKWQLEEQPDGSFKIVNATCNKYLRVENSSSDNGANVGIKNDFGTESFKWILQESPIFPPFEFNKCYQIVNKATNKVLEVKDASQAEDAQIYQWASANNRLQQLWVFKLTSDGKYNIISKNSSKLIDAPDCTEGGILKQFALDGTNSQKWNIEVLPDGYFKLRNETCNKYLRVESASTADGASVGIKNDFGAESFKWFFRETSCTPVAVLASQQTFTFEAQAKEGQSQLQWIMKGSFNYDYFEIQRLNPFGTYEVLGIQNAKASDQNLVSYSYIDDNPQDGDNYYRIKAVSDKIPPQFSEIKKVSFIKTNDVNIYPNPADEYINIDLKRYVGKAVTIYMYNSLGVLLKQVKVDKASAAPQRVDVQGFVAGNYLLRFQVEGKRETAKFFNIAR